MTNAKQEALHYARNWWESKRPVAWDIKQHLEHPSINTSTECEKDLAISIARVIMEEAG